MASAPVPETVSYLFVPASRPDRFEKALAGGADAVIVDLEDAVPPQHKNEARAHLVSALTRGLRPLVYVRINSVDSRWFSDDLAALASLPAGSIAGLVVPKAEERATIERVRQAVSGVAVIALIESAVGVSHLRQIASGATRLALGALDLSVDLDIGPDSTMIDWVYAQLVLESRLAGLPSPIASPPTQIHDPDAVRDEALRLCSLGMTAQLCVHPAQVEAVHAGFAPSESDVVWARRVIAASNAAGDAAVQLDGQMIDKPVVERAERVLKRIRQAR